MWSGEKPMKRRIGKKVPYNLSLQHYLAESRRFFSRSRFKWKCLPHTSYFFCSNSIVVNRLRWICSYIRSSSFTCVACFMYIRFRVELSIQHLWMMVRTQFSCVCEPQSLFFVLVERKCVLHFHVIASAFTTTQDAKARAEKNMTLYVIRKKWREKAINKTGKQRIQTKCTEIRGLCAFA